MLFTWEHICFLAQGLWPTRRCPFPTQANTNSSACLNRSQDTFRQLINTTAVASDALLAKRGPISPPPLPYPTQNFRATTRLA